MTDARTPDVPMPQAGDSAPPIHAKVTNDGVFDLQEQADRWVVVYFYPRANTPG